MTDKNLLVNVVVVPDERTIETARRLGEILGGKYDCYYSLDDKSYIPHISVYQAQYPRKNIELVRKYTVEAAAETTSFTVEVKSYQTYYTFIFWNLLQNPSLTNLHYRLLEKLNPLREGLLMPHLTTTGYMTGEKFTEEEAEAVQKYGTIVVGKLFKPHITLARLKKVIPDEELKKVLPQTSSTFKVSSIYIGKMGDHGTVTDILETFDFKQ
jgi:hypothetical protein